VTAEVVELPKHLAGDEDVNGILALKAELVGAVALDGDIFDLLYDDRHCASSGTAPFDQPIELNEAVSDNLSEAAAMIIAGDVGKNEVVVDESDAVIAGAGDVLQAAAVDCVVEILLPA
jgi:hypothetical protein